LTLLSNRLHYSTSIHDAPCASAHKENFFGEAHLPLCIVCFSGAALAEGVEADRGVRVVETLNANALPQRHYHHAQAGVRGARGRARK